MARKTFEMSFQIGGKLASSFTNAFQGVSKNLVNVRNQARQTQRDLDRLNNDFKRGKITQDQYSEATERMTRELTKLEQAQKRVQNFRTAFSNGLNTTKQVASITALGSTVAATAIALDSVNQAGRFEQQMAKVGVIAGASSSDLQRLNNTALELGASTSLSASQVASAMTELAAKGMDTNKIINAMPGILSAAEASGEDLAMTSDVVTSALNAFELGAEKANHVADVMAMSANKTAAGVEDLGYSFKYAAPVANTLGIRMEELASATGLMVDRGLAGEQAGTSLRMALIRLSDPPKEARKVLDKLNLSVTDSEGKFKSLAELSEEWNKATKDLTDTQKVQYASTVFGTEAATGMINLFAAGADKIDNLTTSLETSTGAANEAAKAMKDNYAGSLEQLQGAYESAQIKFMTPVLPVLEDTFKGLTGMIDDNMGGIEKAGEKFASGLRDILDPFAMQKPEFSKELQLYPEAMAQYQKDMKKYNLFQDMDFGDKVVYMLDETMTKVEEWLSGSGGESMNKIFTKLGEIAAKAWYKAFTGAVETSMENLGEGNVFSALGTGALAYMLGGGALIKGGIGLGRGAINLGKKVFNKRGSSAKEITSNSSNTKKKNNNSSNDNKKKKNKKKQAQNTNTPNNNRTKASTSSSKKNGIGGAFSKATGFLGKGAKFVGQRLLPIAVATTALDAATSDDKPKAIASGAGGIAGGLGGAAAGAAAGSVVPLIGTTIGGIIGGIIGSVGGSVAGGKAVDASNPKVANYASQRATTIAQKEMPTGRFSNSSSNKINTEASKVSEDTKKLKESTTKVNDSLKALAEQSKNAEGWLESLKGIKTAGQQVEEALRNLSTRINNVQVPSSIGGTQGLNKRVSYDG
ncbi:phage tail tape measure protein [Gracilibacillus oryzae]|uniref:Phage tail tape measure protein n=1 Tax=Gracilibacillus oryzae TaxID=1672701 RepID=A0A7C8KRU5_9BACI|nr:phage tail tape measure protein [Gracilibacillus oryzae]KAB8126904.1 phage tail tape measure protein [Gracilibacillus oryzae]